MKHILLTLAATLTVTGGTLYEIKPEVKYTAADKDFAAAYPKINWKAGKTLNYESKEEMKTWVEGLK